jgi:hypothetical protein
LSRKQLPSDLSKRFNKNRRSKSGGIRKADGLKKRSPGEKLEARAKTTEVGSAEVEVVVERARLASLRLELKVMQLRRPRDRPLRRRPQVVLLAGAEAEGEAVAAAIRRFIGVVTVDGK